MNILSDNLKKARHHAGLTQEKAAAAILVKRSMIGAWEEGRCRPTLIVFPRVVLVYDILDWKGFITDPNWMPGKELPTDPRDKKLASLQRRYDELRDRLKGLARDC